MEEQKPVAWAKNLTDAQPRTVTSLSYCSVAERERGDDLKYIPLYTHPVRPLTDDQITLIIGECAARHEHTDYGFARAIEAAHGIGGEK